MSEKEYHFDDVRHHFDSIDTLLQVIEDENAILKREVDCLRDEKAELEERAKRAGEYACCMTRLANQKRKLKERINELNEYADALESDNEILENLNSKWEARANEQLSKNETLEAKIESGAKAMAHMVNEIVSLNETVQEQKNINQELMHNLKNWMGYSAKYRREATVNRIEADLWKLILELGLEDVLDKFYIDVPEEPNSWRYVHFLVNEDYDGGRPEFDVSQQFSSGRVVFMFYKNREDFDAKAEFDKAVKYAKQGPITL